LSWICSCSPNNTTYLQIQKGKPVKQWRRCLRSAPKPQKVRLWFNVLLSPILLGSLFDSNYSTCSITCSASPKIQKPIIASSHDPASRWSLRIEVLATSYINLDFYSLDYSPFLYPVSENLEAPQPHLHVVPVGFLFLKSKELGWMGSFARGGRKSVTEFASCDCHVSEQQATSNMLWFFELQYQRQATRHKFAALRRFDITHPQEC
jgi:hypothetical protein